MAYGSTIPESMDSRDSRKKRGAFYTPSELTRVIAKWAIKSPDTTVLEPACGESEFIIAAYRELLSRGVSSKAASNQITCCELHAESLEAGESKCRAIGCTPDYHLGSFLEMEFTQRFDAVIGNPPYVRFQSIGESQRDAIGNIMEKAGMGGSRLSSLWVPFVYHAVSCLSPGGRLGFVLPAELLSVNYAAPVRSFLMERFSSISLLTFDERVFPEVQEEVVVLLAEGCGNGPAKAIEWSQCRNLSELYANEAWEFRPLAPDAKWTYAFISMPADNLRAELRKLGFASLESWGKVSLGTVTGNNGYFTLTPEEAHDWGFRTLDTSPISPPGSRHLRTLEFDPASFADMNKAGKKTVLFYPHGKLSEAAQRYISYGESIGVDKGYKCRKRKPWWRVPLAAKADAFVTYMNDYAPSLCANRAGVYHLNSIHGIIFHEGFGELAAKFLPLAFLNTATSLDSELAGRSYGGGMLKLEPREAADLLVPSPQLVEAVRPELDEIHSEVQRILKDGDVPRAIGRVDEVFAKVGGGSWKELVTVMSEDKARLYGRRKLRGRAKG